MVVPSGSPAGGTGKDKMAKSEDYELIYKDLSYEMNLYNKPYSDYIYRKELKNNISQAEYEEWEYHQFDFYRDFDRDFFLRQLLSSVQQGGFRAFRPGEPSVYLTADELEQLLEVPRTEINSIIFQEDWYLNRKNLDLKKVVKSLILVRHIDEYDNYTGEFIRTRKEQLAGIQISR
jgi:hypothetical protein